MKASVLALALLCASPVFAQNSTSNSTSAATREANHMNNLATLLDLTDAQKAKVQTILEQEHAKMKQSFEQAKAAGTKPDWQQMKALHQQLQQETLQQLSTVLSATQMKKFQVLSQMHHPHFRHGGPSSNTAAPASQS
jgi:ribulose bisphosphate carboxylase small subunit